VSTIDVNEGRDNDNLNRTVSPRDRQTSIIKKEIINNTHRRNNEITIIEQYDDGGQKELYQEGHDEAESNKTFPLQSPKRQDSESKRIINKV
jgi:hypothetical protein